MRKKINKKARENERKPKEKEKNIWKQKKREHAQHKCRQHETISLQKNRAKKD